MEELHVNSGLLGLHSDFRSKVESFFLCSGLVIRLIYYLCDFWNVYEDRMWLRKNSLCDTCTHVDVSVWCILCFLCISCLSVLCMYYISSDLTLEAVTFPGAVITNYCKLGSLEQQKFYSSQFQRSEVQNQGVSKPMLPLNALGEDPSSPSLASWGCWWSSVFLKKCITPVSSLSGSILPVCLMSLCKPLLVMAPGL